MDANRELIDALNQIEKEKDISKDILLEALENSLVAACKNNFGRADNIKVFIDRETGAVNVYAMKEVVEEVTDPVTQISLAQAKMKEINVDLEDVVSVEVTPKNFGRIAAQKAKQVVVQKIREEERKVLYQQYSGKERDIVTGIVQRYVGNNVSINLGKVDAMLNENEQVRGEMFHPTDRIKLYVLEVKDSPKGPRILVSRTHPELVKRLFEAEVTEIQDGTVEIMSIAREAGSRTKMAVWSNNPNVDAVGACVGLNGSRVNAIVYELRDEKIDIINWSNEPAKLIENALSPAKVVSVMVSENERSARVTVPDYQLSLAIGKEGQNARLAAKLTGYKIDIKSESQSMGY
jgi:N utilization substance protein A